MLTCSNYTTKIDCASVARKYVYTLQSNQCFAAYMKAKRDCMQKPVPNVSIEDLVYFEHDFRESCQIDRVYNIDLKSAYATVLQKEGIISTDTFNYLSRLPKHDRLAAVGMLASKKKTFTFDHSGEVKSYDTSISNLENFFYFAVQKTYEIMSVLKMILGDCYLFTWVDGIYFMPDMKKLVACEDYLRSIHFKYSEDVLTNWDVRVVKGAVKLFFIKEGQTKCFSLPAKESEFNRIIADVLCSISKAS